MAVTPEGRIKREVSKMLAKYVPDVYVNMPVPMGYGESMLDYVGCANGAFFMIETKAPGKKPTDRQLQCKSRVLRAGGTVLIVNEAPGPQLDKAEAWIQEKLGCSSTASTHGAGARNTPGIR